MTISRQWAAANCTVPPSVIAGQYATLNCKLQLVRISLSVPIYKCQQYTSRCCLKFVDGVCAVYTQDLLDECQWPSPADDTSKQSSCSTDSLWRSVIIIVPMRLGGEVINPMYIPCLQALLSNSCCLGLIGGKPRHSLYFVGWQGILLLSLLLCSLFVIIIFYFKFLMPLVKIQHNQLRDTLFLKLFFIYFVYLII